ncbi:MAG: hypothetical protein ACR2HY_10410 [Acidimicrobiales bacterium]
MARFRAPREGFVLIACWSPKGGSGTTVVSSALALVLAGPGGSNLVLGDRATGKGGPVLLVDLAGDVPAVLGVPEPAGPGVSEWLAAGPEVPRDALSRLEVEAGGGIRLVPLGDVGIGSAGIGSAGIGSAGLEAAASGRGEALATALAADRRPVVADCGRADDGAALAVAAGATLSLLVLRPCYLALRRAMAAPIRPSGVVLVTESGRSLGRRDVEEVLGVPVRAEISYDPAVARAVDAGLLATRVPRALERSLRLAA